MSECRGFQIQLFTFRGFESNAKRECFQIKSERCDGGLSVP